jgi:glucosamine-6-phosphate deaminase
LDHVIARDYEDLSTIAAALIARAIRDRPEASIVAATGNSPIGTYRELAQRFREGELDPSRIRLFQLDEYVGVDADDHRSLYRWLESCLLDPLLIPPERTVRLRGDAADLCDARTTYERAVREAGGFDLAILGLGPNGHLGFNEPPSDPASRTRLVELTPETLRSNAGYWGDGAVVPRLALTAGMDLLLASRRIVVVVSGAQKREILRRVLHGQLSPETPASYLRAAPSVILVADRAAAGHQE